jgi:hypothetical protein
MEGDKMKKDVADKWVAALRSGQYQQGRNMLRTRDNKYCCLGVLCDISGLGKWVDTPYIAEPGYRVSNWCVEDLLSPPVQEYAGIATAGGVLPNKHTLSDMNDDGATFEQLADLIEQHWESL